MPSVRLCILIPTYDNPVTIRGAVEHARRYVPDVVVVDDGSHEPGRSVVASLAELPGVVVRRHETNRGKGAAVKSGFAAAHELGFTHAIQVDGDGQHDLERIPTLIELAERNPEALILGTPVYDHTLHRGRYAARLVTRFWNYVEVLGPTIADSMCGFRVYPIRAALAASTRGNRMDFDIEIPVRMVWNGVPVINTPVGVRYLGVEEGGVSHYQIVADTARISWTHTKLVCEGLVRLIGWPLRRLIAGRRRVLGDGEPRSGR